MQEDPKVRAMVDAVDEIVPHVSPWLSLLQGLAENLPADTPESPEAPGTTDRAYAEHELKAYRREMMALLVARRALEALYPKHKTEAR